MLHPLWSRLTSSGWEAFHFTAGLGSGILSAVLLQPADLLKTRVQQSSSTSLGSVIREIARGPRPIGQFWRGTVPSALRTGLGSALYFSSLNALRQHVAQSAILTSSGIVAVASEIPSYSSSTLPKLSNLANLTTGAVARASVGFLMMPITVIKVRYESSFYEYRSIWGAASDMLRKEGIRGFFAGFSATAIRDAPFAGLYVLFYEQCKRRLSLLCHAAPSSLGFEPYGVISGSTSATINFSSGLLAAGLATAITNPFDAIKTRMQLHPRKYGNIFKASTLMVKEGGFRSLLDGLGLRMARKAISSALAWTLYEELIRRAGRRWVEGAKDTTE